MLINKLFRNTTKTKYFCIFDYKIFHMKKSKKFILGLIILLVIAIGVLLAFPDLFDTKDTPEQDAKIENVEDIEDNPFD